MWPLFALASGFLVAVTGTLIKTLGDKLSPGLGFAIQSFFVALTAWLIQWRGGSLRADVAKLELRHVGMLALIGVIVCVQWLFYTNALKAGDSMRVQPVDRLSLVFAVGLGALFLREKAGPQVWAGAALMAVGAILVATAKTS
jgi:transporter family protein